MNTRGSFDPRHEFPLPGLDGANPLGFLSALGLLRTVISAPDYSDTELKWIEKHGTWVPCLVGSNLDSGALLDLLEARLAKDIKCHPIRILDILGNADAINRKDLFRQASQEAQNARWLAALASSITDPSAVNNQLQTARRDYFFGNLTSVMARTNRQHLERTILHPWDYSDPLDNQSLHLDPSEDRRHALQWNKPAGDPNRKLVGGMLGANRLAIEAIVWFASFPEGKNLHTTGFTGFKSRNTRWTWPIWDVPLGNSTIRSTLTLQELQEEDVSTLTAHTLQRRGVTAAFRVARILVGKTPNFTPTQRVA